MPARLHVKRARQLELPAQRMALSANEVLNAGLNMSDREGITLSERCRALAQLCRAKAQSFRNEGPRTKMLQLADDYEHKARQAEAFEAFLQKPSDEDISLVPDASERRSLV